MISYSTSTHYIVVLIGSKTSVLLPLKPSGWCRYVESMDTDLLNKIGSPVPSYRQY